MKLNIQKIVLIITFCVIKLFAQSGWSVQNSGIVKTVNQVYFINSNTGYAASNGGWLLKTTNGGALWYLYKDFITDVKRVRFFDQNNGVVFNSKGFYRTTNNGLNWNLVSFSEKVTDVSFDNINTLFASFSGGNILKSTDLGNTWGLVYPLNRYTTAIHFINSNTGYGATFNEGGGYSWHSINKTTNSGIQWDQFYTAYTQPGAGKTGDVFFLNQDTGYFSVKLNNVSLLCRYDNAIWRDLIVDNFQNSLYFINGKTGWSSGENGSTYKTTNAGVNWLLNYAPVTENLLGIFFINDITGWACGENGIIIKTTNGGIPLGIHPLGNNIPDNYTLSQNYPNPFNPITKIKFQIPLSRGVSGGRGVLTLLTVYDVLGKEVQLLINEELQPGSYEAEWDASAYPSGVYYYKFEVSPLTSFKSGFTETRKMVLIK